jgi:hypothetical protein
VRCGPGGPRDDLGEQPFGLDPPLIVVAGGDTDFEGGVVAVEQGDLVGLRIGRETVPDGVCVLPPWGGCINVWINNQRILTIYPGYLSWPTGRLAEDLPSDLFPDVHTDEKDQWHLLSTFRPHAGGPRRGEPAQKFCPIHGLALPLTGVCDDCG